MGDFKTPSAVAAVGPDVLLFQGNGADSKGTHDLQLFSAPIPTDPTRSPSWSQANLRDDAGVAVKDAVFTKLAASVSPVAVAYDSMTVDCFWAGTGEVSPVQWGYGLNVDTFVRGQDGGFVHYASNVISPALQESPKATFGVSAVPGVKGALVVCPTGSGMLELRFLDPPEFGPYHRSVTALGEWTPPAVDPAWTHDVSIAVVRNPIDPTPEEPYLLLLGLWAHANAPQLWSLRLGSFAEGPVAPDFASLKRGTLESGSYCQNGLTLHRGADGAARIVSVNASRQCFTWMAPIPSEDEAQLPLGDPDAAQVVGDVDWPSPVFYTFGGFDDPGTTSVPAYLWMQAGRDGIAWQIGTARRTPFEVPEDEQAKGLLVGIIEGPPPVPNENVQLLEGSQKDNVGVTRFGLETEKETDTTYQYSIGMVAKVSGDIGGVPFLAEVNIDMEVEAGIKGSDTTRTVQTLNQSYGLVAGVVSDGEKNFVDPKGIAFVYRTDYAGFEYRFLDNAGTPYGDSYVQLYAGRPRIDDFAFVFDPAAKSGIIPGQLPSYSLDPETLRQLEASCAAPGNVGDKPAPVPAIYFSWATGGGRYSSEVSVLTAKDVEKGPYVDTSLLIGTEVAGVKVETGVKSQMEWSTKWGQSQKTTISSEVELPSIEPEDKTPGKFQRYGYWTLMLQPDPQYAAELVQQLAYEDEHQYNATLLAAFLPEGSVPWKLTHVIEGEDWVEEPGDGSTPAATERFLAGHRGWQPRTFPIPAVGRVPAGAAP